MDCSIRRITAAEQVDQALDLVWNTFLEFEAPDYEAQGVANFRAEIMENESFRASLTGGDNRLWCAFDGEKLVGVLALRGDNHVCLAFVHRDYQRRGIATRLYQTMLKAVRLENPEVRRITVNSSPYGVPFYHNLGFYDLGPELTSNGIRFTPMAYDLLPDKCGAFLYYQGRFPFLLEREPDGALNVARIGGARAPEESPLACVKRSVQELLGLRVDVYSSARTYLREDGRRFVPVEDWEELPGANPILVFRSGEGLRIYTYLCFGEGRIRPPEDAPGILVPTPGEIHKICGGRMTLGEYLEAGGELLGGDGLSREALLVPRVQIHFLDKMLQEQGEFFVSAGM